MISPPTLISNDPLFCDKTLLKSDNKILVIRFPNHQF